MIKVLTRIKDFFITVDQTRIITIETKEPIEEYLEEIKDCDLYTEFSRYRRKRSLDANAYCWALLTKLAEKLSVPSKGSERGTVYTKDDLYLIELKKYGQGGIVKVPNDMVELFKRTYIYHEKHENLPDEERAQYYRFWLGSSNYNTEEMSRLINGIVEDCKDLGIQTETPEEINKMLNLWGEE